MPSVWRRKSSVRCNQLSHPVCFQFSPAPRSRLCVIPEHLLVLLGSPRALRCATLEAIREFPCNVLQGSHPASARSLSPLCLLAPFVCNKIAVSVRILEILEISFLGRYNPGRNIGCDVHFRILAAGYPHDEQVCFWMCNERRPRCPMANGQPSYCL
jgi:hypothetical protein